VPGVGDQTIRLVLEQLRNEGKGTSRRNRPIRDLDAREYRTLRMSALQQ